ncbi:MAG: NAD-dependent epimerase/dehydratase family protein [Flavitalea sp.]
MRVVIIGGTGHVGTYLVPRLVKKGYEVICVTRQQRKPYRSHPAWKKVKIEVMDRKDLEEKKLFGQAIKDLSPDIVIDMICFTPESARMLVSTLKGSIQHFLHCGTMWVHGHSVEVPSSEDQPRFPFDDYGIKKAAIEKYLLEEYRQSGFPVTLLHPGHIVGPGWKPVNPAGNLDPKVFDKLANGEELALPNLGMETLHHVHADDVAQAFLKALQYPKQAIGQSFHVVSPKAITLRGYAECMANWFGKTANLVFLSWEEWEKTVSEQDALLTWDHIAHSPNGSIEKARKLLKYNPKYTSLQAVQESVAFMKPKPVK